MGEDNGVAPSPHVGSAAPTARSEGGPVGYLMYGNFYDKLAEAERDRANDWDGEMEIIPLYTHPRDACKATIELQRDRIETLVAEIAKLKEALVPFAKVGVELETAFGEADYEIALGSLSEDDFALARSLVHPSSSTEPPSSGEAK
jgi:hypothetical protein